MYCSRIDSPEGFSVDIDSRIHKPKYLDDGLDKSASKKEKKARSKSRTRKIFGIKRTNTASSAVEGA